MAKFIDKKERVIDFQLTPFGRRKLARGKLKPTYYSFYDDGVIYDSDYVGFDESQNQIHQRIKNETAFIEGILSFEEIETSVPPGNYLELAIEDIDVLPHDYDVSPDKNVLQTNKFLFDSAIGDAMFEGKNTQAAPSWKIITCQGEIINHSTRDTAKYDFTHVTEDNEAREFNIPQLDVDLYYTKLIDKPSDSMQFTNIPDTISETKPFIDGYSIKLVRDDLVVYADEVNTQLLTENFDIEIFYVNEEVGEAHTITELEKKFFEKEIPQIVDGLMLSKNPEKNMNRELTTEAVEYYFDVLTDSSVDAKIACECANTFNKNSYYIDLDFDEEKCKEPENEIYFDI